MFIVRAFIKHTITVAVGTRFSFHLRLRTFHTQFQKILQIKNLATCSPIGFVRYYSNEAARGQRMLNNQ